MASAEQLKNLIEAHINSDDNRFKTIALQISASEARVGHTILANDIKDLIDKDINNKNKIVQINNTNPMLYVKKETHFFSELIASNDLKDKILRIIVEYKNSEKLASYGLANRKKILLEGNPGTGKTLTASIIATELSLPLYVVQMDRIVSKYLGETSTKLRQVFDSINSVLGIYFFDEFDAIGANRDLDNEVGEMRRILNSFLQFIEQSSSKSIIIAATNNKDLLDRALFRRFDDVLHYNLPKKEEIKLLLNYKLSFFKGKIEINDDIVNKCFGLSQAEITCVCNDVIKYCIINDLRFDLNIFYGFIDERKNYYQKREA